MEGFSASFVFIRRSRRRSPSIGYSRSARRGFTLVELVMVVTIIGIIAAIAVPRVSSASNNATRNALEATLSNVRNAIDTYYAEHNFFPGYDPANGSPDGDQFVKQLTMYSDVQGHTNATPAGPYLFGPYLRAPFPVSPANQLRTVAVKAAPASADPAAGSVGWVAVLSTGDFGVSATDAQFIRIGIIDASKKLEVSFAQ
jgi:prepilin-type N-terminal cleavage/methylation domain-containing protein